MYLLEFSSILQISTIVHIVFSWNLWIMHGLLWDMLYNNCPFEVKLKGQFMHKMTKLVRGSLSMNGNSPRFRMSIFTAWCLHCVPTGIQFDSIVTFVVIVLWHHSEDLLLHTFCSVPWKQTIIWQDAVGFYANVWTQCQSGTVLACG